jgi:ParB family chromosome partitioning protein
LRLLDLPEFVRQSLLQGDISMGHARAVAAAPDPEALTREIVAKGLSVRQAEARAKRARQGPGELVLTAERKVDADLAALERQLSDMLGVNVQVVHKGQGGTVTLNYSSLDQLDMICQRLSGEPI